MIDSWDTKNKTLIADIVYPTHKPSNVQWTFARLFRSVVSSSPMKLRSQKWRTPRFIHFAYIREGYQLFLEFHTYESFESQQVISCSKQVRWCDQFRTYRNLYFSGGDNSLKDNSSCAITHFWAVLSGVHTMMMSHGAAEVEVDVYQMKVFPCQENVSAINCLVYLCSALEPLDFHSLGWRRVSE